jgi:CheY-like chemotaxis protein
MRVFIVEDEVLLTVMLKDILAGLGCRLVGSAQTVFQALSQLAGLSSIDAAILDLHIGGEMVFPVADALVQRGVPIVFSTGFEPGDLATRYPGCALLPKPYPSEALSAALARFRSAA